jgi:hypothetical protein
VTLLALVRRVLGQADAPSTALAVRAALPMASGLSRRQFLQRTVAGIAGAAVASTLDYERLLWMPADRTIFLPHEAPFFPSVDWITREVLHVLKNKLRFADYLNATYDDQFQAHGAKIGDTVNIRKPNRFVPWASFDEPIEITDICQPVTLAHQYAVELDPTGLHACRSEREARVKLAEPAATVLAETIRHHRLDVFADLPLPVPQMSDHAVAVRSPEDGLALRGVEYFDWGIGEARLRLDILGGSSQGGPDGDSSFVPRARRRGPGGRRRRA